MSKWTNNTLINSDAIWTSTLMVPAHKRVGASIWIGSMPSAAAQTTPVLSTASCSLFLQKQLAGDDENMWRNVKEWSVVLANGLEDNEEYITTQPEPETCKYRMGCREGSYESGTLYIRIGTM